MHHLLFTPHFSILAILGTLFWIVMLVDVIRRQFREPVVKVGWLLAIVFLHVLGAVIYFFVGRPMGQVRDY